MQPDRVALKDWNDCESVELSGADEIAGVYHRSGNRGGDWF